MSDLADKVRVVVVDDQAVIRAGLRMVIDHEDDLTVVGEAGDGLGAIDVVNRSRPDVVLMDVRMPRLNGIEATRRILDSEVDAPAVLVLTTFEDDEYVFGALRAGASGFLLKDATPDALVSAIRSIHRGDVVVDPMVTGRLVQQWAQLDLRHNAVESKVVLSNLTEREHDILIGLARGDSNRDLAHRLFLSEATIKSHVSALLAKLGLRSRVQAVIVAYESGLVRVGDPGNIGWTD